MNRTDNLLALLQVHEPIIQAPMVGVSTPALAAAVSNAGALGSIGIGASSPEQAREMIAATRALTEAAFNVNCFCHRPAVAHPGREAAWLDHLAPLFAEFGAEPPRALREIYRSFVGDEAMLEALLDEAPSVVSFHFGLPSREVVRALKARGIVLLASATTPDEAAEAEAIGVDAIVAQGVEAGGHRGVFHPERGDAGIGTFALVRLVARQVSLPVIAAGGIMDGAGIAAAMLLGASGAQLGTAFVLAPESSANAGYRAALTSERAYRTGITAAISGRAARGLVNRMHTDVDRADAPPMPDYPMVYDAGKALHAAASASGSDDFAAHWAGQGAPLAREMPAGDLVRLLAREWREASAA